MLIQSLQQAYEMVGTIIIPLFQARKLKLSLTCLINSGDNINYCPLYLYNLRIHLEILAGIYLFIYFFY